MSKRFVATSKVDPPSSCVSLIHRYPDHFLPTSWDHFSSVRLRPSTPFPRGSDLQDEFQKSTISCGGIKNGRTTSLSHTVFVILHGGDTTDCSFRHDLHKDETLTLLPRDRSARPPEKKVTRRWHKGTHDVVRTDSPFTDRDTFGRLNTSLRRPYAAPPPPSPPVLPPKGPHHKEFTQGVSFVTSEGLPQIFVNDFSSKSRLVSLSPTSGPYACNGLSDPPNVCTMSNSSRSSVPGRRDKHLCFRRLRTYSWNMSRRNVSREGQKLP